MSRIAAAIAASRVSAAVSGTVAGGVVDDDGPVAVVLLLLLHATFAVLSRGTDGDVDPVSMVGTDGPAAVGMRMTELVGEDMACDSGDNETSKQQFRPHDVRDCANRQQ